MTRQAFSVLAFSVLTFAISTHAAAQCAGGIAPQTGLAAVSCSGVAAWNGSTAYAAGASVTLNNCLYIANRAISANPAWIPGSPGLFLYGNGSACPTAGCNYGAQGPCSGSATATPTARARATATPTASARATATATGRARATATATTRPRATATATTGGGGGGSTRSAPYADISLAVGQNIATDARTAGLKGVTFAFVVDSGCTATWSGLGTAANANATFPNGTTVKSTIDTLVANGTAVIISWGGANGSALTCGTASQAQAMYQSVFNAYPNISGQDFDIEGGVNATVLGQALAGLKAANPSKSVSVTLPVLPTGLVAAGLAIVNGCHAAGFHPDTVNVMAMDYGSANDNGGNMLLSAQQAAASTRSQTGDNIGVTPMIGVNDTSTEIFTLQNARDFVAWAKGQSYINRLAFWSMARDNGGCAGTTFASPSCSGLSQTAFQFSSIFVGF